MRSSSFRRIAVGAAAVASGAVVLASPNMACESYLVESAFSSLDFCFIFDCNNGILGGTVDPCAGGLDAAGENTPGLFVDFPEEEEE